MPARKYEVGALCAIADCLSQPIKRGLCDMHYARTRQGTPMDQPKRGTLKTCTVVGCDRPLSAKFMCVMHYQRVRESGAPGPAAEKKRFKGQPWHDPRTGYVYQGDEERGRPVLQHRLVVERAIGRQLHSWEQVHHRNGQRSDNRLENLEIWVKPQPAGQRPEDLLRWCDENKATLQQDAAWNEGRA